MKWSWNWANILCAYFGLFCFSLLDNFRGPFFPEILLDLKLTNTQGSLFFVVPSLFAVIGSQCVPNLVERWSSLLVWRLGLLLMGFPFLGFVLVDSLTHLLALVAVFGVGFGMVQVSQHLVIQEGAEPRDIRKLFSGLHSMYAVAALIAPLLVGMAIHHQLGWRYSFLIVGTLPLLLLALSYRGQFKEAQSEAKAEVAPKEYRGQFIYVAFMVAFYMATELMISTRLVFYMQDHYLVSAQDSQYYLFAFFLGLFVGRVLFTWRPLEHFRSKHLLMVFLSLTLLCLLLGLFVSPWFISLCGLAMAPIFAVYMNYLSRCYKQYGGSAMAYAMGFGAFIIVAMHYGVGRLTDIYGIHSALHVGIGTLVGAIALIWWHEPLFKKSFVKAKN